MKSWLDREINGEKSGAMVRIADVVGASARRRMAAALKLCFWVPALLGCLCMNAGADQATLQETYSESYSCGWDCPPEFYDLPSFPGFDPDDYREDYCEWVCAERHRVTASIKLVLTLPTLRYLDLRSAGRLGLSVGGLEFSLDEASRSSSNSVTFPQYREDENEYGQIIRRRTGTVVISKKVDVLTVSASRTTPRESLVAGQFTHETGTLDGAINIGQVPVRVEVAGLVVEREIPFKALTRLKARLVPVERYDGDPAVTTELRTFSTVKVSGTAAWANPILAVTTPVPALRWSNQVLVASGTVLSFVHEPTVWVQLNQSTEWMEISPTNGLWEVLLELQPGTNRLFACAVDDAGRFSRGILLHFVQVRTSPVQLEVRPSASVGSLTGAANGDLLEEGVIYRLTPLPAPGYLFEKWEMQSPVGGTKEIAGIAAPRLAFTHETNLHIRAHFVRNRFLGIRNKYAGIIRPHSGTNLPAAEINQGLITLQFSNSGALKGSYTTARKTFAFSSQIHPADGTARLIFDAGKATEATAFLTFDLDHGRWVSGSLTGGAVGWTAVIEAYPEASPDEASPFAGSHTFAIPGVDSPNAASLPAGYGFGTLKVSGSGVVNGVGAAGDGTSLVFKVPLVKCTDGISISRFVWPFFNSKRQGEIMLRGFIEISTTNTLDAASPLHWSKRGNFRDDLYPIGFDDSRFLQAGGLREWIMARYRAPGRGTNTAGFANALLTLSGGNLPGPMEVKLSITPEDKVTVVHPNPTALTLKFSRATGGFTGTFLHPQSGKKTRLAGVMLQSAAGSSGSNAGFGWFPGWNQTGAVMLEQTDAP